MPEASRSLHILYSLKVLTLRCLLKFLGLSGRGECGNSSASVIWSVTSGVLPAIGGKFELVGLTPEVPCSCISVSMPEVHRYGGSGGGVDCSVGVWLMTFLVWIQMM